MMRLLALSMWAPLVVQAQTPSIVRDYQPGIDAQHYSFTVVIPDSGKHVAVTSTMYFRRPRDADHLTLDLESEMLVTKVTLDAREVKFTRSAHAIQIPLTKWNASCAKPDVPRGDGPSPCLSWVIVETNGEPADGLIITQDAQKRWLYYADHWPNRARGWLPTIDHPSDKATVEWRVHAPTALRVVANGVLKEESPMPNEPGRSITVWQTEKPIATYLMTIGVAPMARINLGPTACGLADGGGCVQQDVYEAPELAPRSPPGFQQAGNIVAWLSKWVAPFPFEKLSHLQSSTRFGGMENASAIFYANGGFRNMTLNEGLVAHETAHQWFGDAVTEARWSDAWLSEGFATYLAALWQREAHGDSAFRRTLAGIRAKVLRDDTVKVRPVIDTTQTNLMLLLNANSYEKGGFFLHMLRMEVGDSAWIRGIRAYYAAHKHGNGVTADLRTAIEAESHTDLRWMFDQWLTRPGYTEVDISWTFDRTITVQVKQGGVFGAYRLRIPVEIEDAAGSVTRTVLLVPASASASIAVAGSFSARPRRVTFDPDGDVLGVLTAR